MLVLAVFLLEVLSLVFSTCYNYAGHNKFLRWGDIPRIFFSIHIWCLKMPQWSRAAVWGRGLHFWQVLCDANQLHDAYYTAHNTIATVALHKCYIKLAFDSMLMTRAAVVKVYEGTPQVYYPFLYYWESLQLISPTHILLLLTCPIHSLTFLISWQDTSDYGNLCHISITSCMHD